MSPGKANIGVDDIIALEQERLVTGFGEGVGEAVTEVQASFSSSAVRSGSSNNMAIRPDR